MDPEMMKYFRKIINSFSMGFLWIAAAAMAGLYFGLALFNDHFQWYNFVFYTLLLLSLGGLLWYYYRLWR